MQNENRKNRSKAFACVKKSLCLFMTVLMLFSTFSGAVSVMAVEMPTTAPQTTGEYIPDEPPMYDESDVESIEFISAEDFVLTEGVDGYSATRTVYNEETEEWYEESFFYYTYNFWDIGNSVVVNLSDDTSVEYSYSCVNDTYAFFNENGEMLAVNDVNYQYETHWSVGVNYFEVRCLGQVCFVPVEVKANPVESLSYTPVREDKCTLIENRDGHYAERDIYDENGYVGTEEFFCYEFDFSEGDILTLNMTDGTTVDYTYGYSEETGFPGFFDENGEGLPYNIHNPQYENPWTIGGENNYFTVESWGRTLDIYIDVISDPVESVSYTPAQPELHNYIEEVNGRIEQRDSYYDEENDEWVTEEFFYYDFCGFAEDDKLTLNMVDGTKVDYYYRYIYDEYEWTFINEDGETIDVSIDSEQYKHPWLVGGEYNYLVISYGNKTCKMPVNIIPNPVESISFTPVDPGKYILTENVNGYITTRQVYNEQTGEWENEEFFIYDSPGFVTGDIITVKNTDDTVEEYTYRHCDDYGYGFYNENDEHIEFSLDSDQYENPFKIGGEHNYFVMTYCGRSCNVPVTIKENDVAEFSFTPAKPEIYTLIENLYGYWSTNEYYDEEAEEWVEERYFEYNTPWFEDGDVITVVKTDGTTVDYTWYNDDDDNSGFYNDQGETIEVGRSDYQGEYHWTLGSDNCIILDYSGKTYDIPVTIVANPIESISFTPAKPEEYVYTEYKGGEWDELDEGGEFYYYFLPELYDGDTITLNKTDGTSDVYTYEYNEEEDYYGFFNAEGEYIYPERSNNQHTNPWVIDGDYNYILIEYMGVKCEIPVEIVTNPVDSITFTPVDTERFTLTDGIDGSYEYRSIFDEDDDFWTEELFFHFDIPGFIDGDIITLNMTDGRKIDYVYDRGEYGFYNEDGEELYVERQNYQYENPWKVNGENNYYDIVCEGRSYRVEVNILPNPVKSIYFEAAKEKMFVEGVSDGYFETDDETGEKWYYYYLDGFNDGDKLTVSYLDGTSSVYIYEYDDLEDEYIFINKDGKTIRVVISNNQYENHWKENGSHNYAYVMHAGKTFDVPVTVKKNPVTDIKFTPAGEYKFTEGISGGYYDWYYDENDDEQTCYYYHTPEFQKGDKLTVTRADGTVTDYLYNEDAAYSRIFTDADGDSIRVSIEDEQSRYPWKEGGEHNYFYVRYSGIDAKVPVKVTSKAIESFSFEPVTPIELTEGVSAGYMNWDEDHNEKWYLYYLPDFRAGDKITVSFTDGTTVSYSYGGYDEYSDEEYFVSDDGEKISAYMESDQSSNNRWTPGSDAVLTVVAGEYETDVKVTIKPSPVEDVFFTPVNPEKYILKENISGGYYGEDDNYIYYPPDFEEGDKVTVVMNGKSVEYSYDEKNWAFTDGQSWIASWPDSDQGDENYWKADGSKKCFYMEIMGKEVEIPVEIVPCKIKDFSYIPASKLVVTEGLSSGEYNYEWDEDDNVTGKYYYYNIPGFNGGDKFTVTFENGTTDVYTIDISLSYGPAFFNAAGEMLYFAISENQRENHWVPGGQHNYFTLIVGGKKENIPVTVLEKKDIDRIAFTPVAEKAFAENISDGYHSMYEYTDEKTGEIFYKKYYYYRTGDILVNGDKLTLYMKDGTSVDCVYNESAGFILPDGSEADFYIDNCQYENPWVPGGKHNYFEIFLNDDSQKISCKVYVTVGGCAHDYINHDGKAPTCTEKGWEAYVTCKNCDYTTYKEIAAKGHSYTSSVSKAATCAAAGTMLYKCSCGKSYTSAIAATDKHNVVTDKGTPATYKAAGKTDGSHCSVCGTVFKAQTAIEKLKLGKVSALKAKKITLAKASSVVLAWNKVEGAEKYEVYQQKGKKWVKIKTTASTSLTVKKLTAGATYKYKVRAILSGESSGAYSSVLTVDMTPAKTTLSLKAGKKQLTASWKTVSGATGYEVQYSTSKKFTKKTTKTVTIKKAKTKKTTIKKLTKGKKYFVRVRAYKTVGNKNIYSAYSSVKNVKVK